MNYDAPYLGYKDAVKKALGLGYYLSVDNGEEFSVNKSKDYDLIIEHIESVDDSHVHFWKKASEPKVTPCRSDNVRMFTVDGEKWYEYGYMYLVICDVDYDETINDYSVGKYVEEIVADETYIEEM